MPSENEQSALTNGPSDGEALPSFARPNGDGGLHTPKTAQALVDGVGVYTTSLSSPFLTLPNGSNGTNGALPSANAGPTDTMSDELRNLAEPLRQSVEAVPLRLRLNEDELSRVVAAVLELISRSLPIASARKH